MNLMNAERSGQCVRSGSVAVAGRSCSQSLASAHTAVRLQSQEDKAVWNNREFMWAVWSRREPTTTRTKHDTLPTLYPYPIFSSLLRSWESQVDVVGGGVADAHNVVQ